ncbi:MAG: HEAT repeat domain-containing protein [Sandaracinus sp.]|nr:HEAT repeat domain-containing protein [Myxococcales bacterium]MCB9631970.1 HEAT repeat domain-containing protein [Sandaracinus sp.]
MNRRIVLAALVALGAGLASLAFRSSEGGEASPVALATEPTRYALVYESEQAFARGGAEVAGRLDLDVDVELRPRGDRVGLAVVECRRFEWRALGSAIVDATRACEDFVGTESLATSNDDGTLAEVFTAPELSEALAHLHLGLWQELSFTRRASSSYVATERSPRGVAEGEFVHEGDRYERRRVTYEAAPGVALPPGTLERSESTLRMRGETLESLEIDEHFQGEGRLRVHLALSRVGDAPTPPAIELARFVPQRLEDRDARRAADLLERRAAGLTIDELKDLLAEFGDGGHVPEHERFLWRATGLLRLHPELAFELEPLFLGADASSSRRGLVLDLLVHARTAEGQQALRRLLDSEVARQDPRHALHLQRLALVENPDGETVAYATRRFEVAEGVIDRFAAAYTYAGVARESHDPAVAAAAARALTTELEHAPDADSRTHWMRALGATGAPEARAAIVDHLDDSATSVRVAAVGALARQPGDGSELRRALADTHEAVQREALRHVELGASDLAQLERLASQGAWSGRNVEPLVRRLAAARQTHPESVRAVAQALIAGGHARGEVATVLHALTRG